MASKFYFALAMLVKTSNKTDTCLNLIACCSAEIIADRTSSFAAHELLLLAAVISALEQAMKLKLAPFYSV